MNETVFFDTMRQGLWIAVIISTPMLAVALILFLDLDWSRFWPVLVIIVGVGIVARGMWRR